MIHSVRDLALALVSVLLTITFMTNNYFVCLCMFLLIIPWAIMGNFVDELAKDYVEWRSAQEHFRSSLLIDTFSSRSSSEIERRN